LFSFAIFRPPPPPWLSCASQSFFFLHRLNINNDVLSLLRSTLLSFLGKIRSASFFPCKLCLSTELVGSKV
jgi:hypothetical protein